MSLFCFVLGVGGAQSHQERPRAHPSPTAQARGATREAVPCRSYHLTLEKQIQTNAGQLALQGLAEVRDGLA